MASYASSTTWGNPTGIREVVLPHKLHAMGHAGELHAIWRQPPFAWRARLQGDWVRDSPRLRSFPEFMNSPIERERVSGRTAVDRALSVPIASLARQIEVGGDCATVPKSNFQIGFLHVSSPDRIGGHDNQDPDICVGLDDDFPTAAFVSGFDDPPSFHHVPVIAKRSVQHPAKVHLRKAPVDHPLEQMRAELQFPVPPIGPRMLRQIEPRSWHQGCTLGCFPSL